MKSKLFPKILAFFLASTLTMSSTVFFPHKISAATPVIDGIESTVTSGMFAADSLDNTWLFGGGIETQGRFAEIGGVRNYIGQFEEYVRWVKRVNDTLKGMQRYTINAGKAGQDAAAFAQILSGYITRLQPKAVSYLIGPEDYGKGADGIFDFENAVADIIETALDMNGNTGYAVIQLPHAVKDAQASANAASYAESARVIAADIAAARPADAGRIAIVDHFAQTDNNNFKNSMLTDDGLLNAEGHYLTAQQFSQEIYGSTDNFPKITESWTAKEAPEIYLDTAPTATALAGALQVTVPKNISSAEWRYRIETDDVVIEGMASGNPFTIKQLPAGKDYLLKVYTGDGKTQLPTVQGTITAGNTSVTPDAGSSLAEAIRDKVQNTEDSLTWLFMGDSITHGAAHTHGYDSIAQIFEKYLKEDLGRADDIVVNTAVSGATADRTFDNIEQRMTKYQPDIVSVMLGTNDTINAAYQAKLESIVTAIRETNPDALIIFRSPTPAKGSAYAAKLSGPNGSVALMKATAEQDGDILFVDQYTDWNAEITAYPYLFDSAYYFGDSNIHPGAAGQLRMFQQFIRACGLNTDTKIANLSYQFAYTEETSSIAPAAVISDNNVVTIRKNDLEAAYGNGEIGDMTVVLSDSDGRTYTKSCGLEETETNIAILPASRHYTVTVTANMKGSTSKLVTFAPEKITLSTGTESDDLKSALAEQEAVYNSDLSIYTDKSAAAFKAAYDAAKKAADAGETDVETLDTLRTALQGAANALTKKPEPDKQPEDQNQQQPGSNTQPDVVPEGSICESGNYRYKVTSSSKLTVEITGAKNKKLKKISVPASITLNGKTYTVTAIAASAFKGCTLATSITVGKNVASIGKNAFSGCTKVKSATINSTKLKTIGSKAFYNCKALTKLVIKSKVLKTAAKNAFKGIGKKCVIKVPSAKLKSYKKLFSKTGQAKSVKISK